MTPYKKRAKAGWACGKEYKKDSNRSERNYAKEELLKILDEGLQQVKDGKGLTTAEVKKRLRDKFADDTKDLFDESDY